MKTFNARGTIPDNQQPEEHTTDEEHNGQSQRRNTELPRGALGDPRAE